MDMAEKLESPEPVLRKVEELERDRKRIAREIDLGTAGCGYSCGGAGMTGEQVNRMLDAMAGDMERLDRDKLKDFLFTICEQGNARCQNLDCSDSLQDSAYAAVSGSTGIRTPVKARMASRD